MFNAAPAFRPDACSSVADDACEQKQIVDRHFIETIAAEPQRRTAASIARPGFRLEEDFPVPPPPPSLGSDTDRWLSRLGYSRGRRSTRWPRAASSAATPHRHQRLIEGVTQ